MLKKKQDVEIQQTSIFINYKKANNTQKKIKLNINKIHVLNKKYCKKH